MNTKSDHHIDGVIASLSGDYRKAISHYNIALEFEPHNSELYYLRGNALLKLGYAQQACSDYITYAKYELEYNN